MLKKKTSYAITFVVVILTITNIFSPLMGEKFVYKWDPSALGNRIRLPLLETEPDKFTLSFPCSLSRGNSNWILDAQGGPALQIQLSPQKVILLAENTKTNLIRNYNFERILREDCVENVTFLSESRKIIYSSEEKKSEIILSKFHSFSLKSWMQWNDSVSNKEVKIQVETSPKVNIVPSQFKDTLNKLILFFGIIMILVVRPKIPKVKINIKKSEILSFFSLLTLGFIGVPKVDDGWYYLIARVLKQDSIYSNVIFPITLPNGKLPSLILTTFIGENPTILQLRIPSLICNFIIWSLFIRIIFPWLRNNFALGIPSYVFWGIWLVFSAAFLVTLRPEPYIALLITSIIAITIIDKKISQNASFFLIISFMGISISTHQSGLTSLFAGLPIIFFKIYDQIKTREFRFLGIIWGTCVSLFAVFWSSSPNLIFESINSYNKLEESFPGNVPITSNPWEEYERINHLLKYGLTNGLQIYIIVQFILIVIITSIIFLRKFNVKHLTLELKIISSCLFSILGLILVPSKWMMYYGDFVVVFMILLYFLMSHLDSLKRKSINIFFILLISIPLVTATKEGWQNMDFQLPIRSANINFWVYELIPRYSLTFSGLAIIIMIIFYRFIDFKKLLSLFNLLLTSIILLPSFLDSTIPHAGWTFVDQSFKGLWNEKYKCGLAADTYWKTNSEASIQIIASQNQDRVVITPSHYIFSPCLKFINMSYGKWEMPTFISGPVIMDQQRLLVETEIDLPACNSIENNYENSSDICFYKVKSSIPEIKPFTSVQYSYK